jgi:PIN domain
MFATNKTNHLVLDTCTLLHSGELIIRILASIWTKKLNYQLVIPTIVISELKGQQVYMQDKNVSKSYLHLC